MEDESGSAANLFRHLRELDARSAEQQKQIEALSVGLQKVNARIELESSAARLTTNK